MSPQHDPKMDQFDGGQKVDAGTGRFLARRWRRAALAVVLTIVGAVLPWPTLPAMAVHGTGLFEMDGNANASADLAGDDWDALFPLPGGGAALQKSFIDDGTDEATNPPADSTYYTGGGSKDVNGIGDWKYNALGAPDKDEITNAYAAAYTSGGSTYIYFGLDRFDGSGSANAGFWFFQSPISLNADGTFSGVHTEGDIFVVSEFTNGGAISTIKVFAWDTTQANNLREVMSGADCQTAPATDSVCARVNSGPVPAPWQYAPKSGPAGTFPAGSFLEGGVNLSSLFPATVPCFSTFLAETRTSFTPNSQLADFALGSFELCGIDVEKTGDTLSKVGDPAAYTVTITNTGIVTLFKDDISDSLLGPIAVNGANQAISGLTNNCGASLAPLASCTITYTRTVLPGDTDPLVNTVTATYNPLANFSATAITDTDSHSVNLFQPQVRVVKTADPLSAVVGQGINYTITITNVSSSDSPDLVLDSINDSLLGDVEAQAVAANCGTLAPGASCNFPLPRTVQVGDPDPLVNTVTVHYHPAGFPNDITATDSATVNLLQPGINVTKSGPELSKIGDEVTYTFTINNSGQDTLVMDGAAGIVDNVFGNLMNAAPAACDILDPGETCQFSATFTVPQNASDPLVNTVTVLYRLQEIPTETVSASFSHSLNLFQPAVDLTKSGPASGVEGQIVTYTFTVANTGSADSPALVLATATDDKLGDLVAAATAAGCDRLVVGATPCVFTVLHTLTASPDPLTNTASVMYHPEGFPNEIRDTARHTLELFQPSLRVVKTGDTLSKIGDPVTYSFTISNTSSPDTPDLTLTSVVDDKLGSLTAQAAAVCSTLASGASCNFSVPTTVPADASDPLVNTVDVIYHVTGFPTVSATATSNHSMNLFQPGVQVTKTANVTQAKVGDNVVYTITITNLSSEDSPNLVLDSVIDSLLGSVKTQATTAGCDTLTFEESCSFQVTRAVKASDADPVVNTVTVHYHPADFPNDITDTASATVGKVVPPPTYGQDPDDDDLPVEDPYDLAGDPGGPASPIDTAGNNNQTGTEQPAAPTSEPAPSNDVLENNVVVPQPETRPGTLPRTGRGLDQLTKFGAIMLFLGGIAVMSGRRKRDQKA